MQKLWKADLTFTSRFRKNRRTLFMHSPLEIARNYIEVGIHKVNLSIFKTILLGFFAGMFIGFAGIASTTASSTIGIASVAKLVGAAVFPAGMAMVLVAGSELFTGNNLIILAVPYQKEYDPIYIISIFFSNCRFRLGSCISSQNLLKITIVSAIRYGKNFRKSKT